MNLFSSPFSFLNMTTRRRLTPAAIALALAMLGHTAVLGRPLTTEAAPAGIISFEFAGTAANAQAMVQSWDATAQLTAAFLLGYDFLFPLVYGSAIILACLWAIERVRPLATGWAVGGNYLAWGMVVAVLLDYVENVALYQLLFGSTAVGWAPLATICAGVKFLLIGCAIAYVTAVAFITGAKRSG